MYEWLCGEPPFYEGDFIQLGYQHTYVPPDPLSVKTPSISREVESVVNTALAKDPKQRFGSVQAFTNALEQASQANKGYVPPVRPTPPPRSAPTPTPPVATEEYKPPIQQASFASTGSYPGGATSSNYANPKPVTSVPIWQNENPWRFGKRQVVTALIGFAITACLNILLAFNISSNGSLTIILGCIILVAIAPEFFGAVFGPWVGLFTGGGLLVGYIIESSTNPYFQIDVLPIGGYWPIQLGLLIIGFISGFALRKPKGRYNIGRTLGFSALGVAVGTVSTILGWFPFYNISFINSSVLLTLIIALAYLIVGSILLPILLVLYYKIGSRVRRA